MARLKSSRDFASMSSAADWSSAAGSARGLGQPLLGRSHRRRGADQVLTQSHADVSQPGGGRLEALRRAAVLGLIASPALKFGRGDRSLGLRRLLVQPAELIAERAKCLIMGRDGGIGVGLFQQSPLRP